MGQFVSLIFSLVFSFQLESVNDYIKDIGLESKTETDQDRFAAYMIRAKKVVMKTNKTKKLKKKNQKLVKRKAKKLINNKVQNKITQLVKKYSKIYNLPYHYVLAVFHCESQLNHWKDGKILRGLDGEIGIAQLMPATAKILKVNPWSLEENIKGGCKALSIGYKKTGSLKRAYEYYNSGRTDKVPMVSKSRARNVIKVYRQFFWGKNQMKLALKNKRKTIAKIIKAETKDPIVMNSEETIQQTTMF